MIAIGNQFGGPEQKGSPIHNALNRAMNVASDTRDPNYNEGEEGWINPIFIVPGSIWKPEFEGFKLGHFSKKEKGLVVQIEVPQSVADGEGIRDFVGSALREAVKLGAKKFSQHGIPFSALKGEKIIRAIEAQLPE